MEKMDRKQMTEFLRELKALQETVKKEKLKIRSCVETMEEAIVRNTFSHKENDGSSNKGFKSDKVLRVLLDSERDIEEETRVMVQRMRAIYEIEDEIDCVNSCVCALRGIDREIITDVYIENGNIDVEAVKFGYSRNYFYRRLGRAVDSVVDSYNKLCSDQEPSKASRFLREVQKAMPQENFA